MVVGLIRFGPEDDSQFRRVGHSNRAYPPLTNGASDFHAELVIAPRGPSFPFALGVRLARTQIGPPPAPHSHPTSNRWPRCRCAVVFPSRSLLAALPCFSAPTSAAALFSRFNSAITWCRAAGEYSLKHWPSWGYTSCNVAHLSPYKGRWTVDAEVVKRKD